MPSALATGMRRAHDGASRGDRRRIYGPNATLTALDIDGREFDVTGVAIHPNGPTARDLRPISTAADRRGDHGDLIGIREPAVAPGPASGRNCVSRARTQPRRSLCARPLGVDLLEGDRSGSELSPHDGAARIGAADLGESGGDEQSHCPGEQC